LHLIREGEAPHPRMNIKNPTNRAYEWNTAGYVGLLMCHHQFESGMRVLVVEDEPVSACALVAAIESAGHEVLGPAASSHEALSLGESLRPELAIVDLDLEQQDSGFEVAERLQNDHGCAVIFSTDRPGAVRDGRCGIGVLSRPYHLNDAALAVQAAEFIIRGALPPTACIPGSLELLSASDAPGPILLVEDQLGDIDLTMAALKKAGINAPIVVARDGVEALELMSLTVPPVVLPALVLLDIKMPRLNGLEVLKRLKEDGRLREIPIVMLTGSNNPTDVTECLRLGVAEYLVKPASFDQLIRDLSRIKRLLRSPSATV
jgi:CheY-like chemotaxis protein